VCTAAVHSSATDGSSAINSAFRSTIARTAVDLNKAFARCSTSKDAAHTQPRTCDTGKNTQSLTQQKCTSGERRAARRGYMGIMEACSARVLTHLSRAVRFILPSSLTSAPSDALVESSPAYLGARKARCERSGGCAQIVQRQCGVQSVLHQDKVWDWFHGAWHRGAHRRSAARRSPFGPYGSPRAQGRREAFSSARCESAEAFWTGLSYKVLREILICFPYPVTTASASQMNYHSQVSCEITTHNDFR
jgi:hypothetical protein